MRIFAFLFFMISISFAEFEPSHPMAPGGLCVIGNKIYDAEGYEFKFHGINRPSLEWESQGLWIGEADFDAIADLKVNSVRVPMSQLFWLNNTDGYKNRIRSVVDNFRERGIKIILDLHRTDKNGLLTENPGGNDQKMTDRRSVTFWQQIATEFANDGAVIFELFNEPKWISWDIWYNGGMTRDDEGTYEIVGMQEMYDSIRATGADNLILIAGLDWGYELDGVVGREIEGYNIAYVTHLYPYESKLPDRWDKKWRFFTEDYPVVVTEFGPGADNNLSYTQQVMAAGNATGGWMAWVWWWFKRNALVQWPDGSKDPAVNPWKLTDWGNLVRDSLFAAESRYSSGEREKAPDKYFSQELKPNATKNSKYYHRDTETRR